jgi:hypothetical protein
MQVLTGFIDNPNGAAERPPLTPITATSVETVRVEDGHMTLYIYAGFYS